MPFGKAEWLFGSRQVWRLDRWMVVVTGIALSLGLTMDLSGSWWWTWVWGGSKGGAFGQGQVALVADMHGNMTSG